MAQQDLDTIALTLERLTATEKLVLIEQLARSLRPIPRHSSPVSQCDAFRRLRQELAVLPVHNPSEGWSNRHHDQLLYGDA